MNPYFQLIRSNSDFTRMWLAQAVSLLGDWFNTLVLSALVSDFTGGSGLAISLLLLCRFLPPLLVTPFTGVIIDRFNRKHILIISDVARIFVVLGILFAAAQQQLWLIYVLTVAQFAIAAVFEPGRSAFLPELVSPEELTAANVISTTTWSVMLAAGGAIGAVVAGSLGISNALIIDAATFAVSAALIAPIKTRYTPYISEKQAVDAPKPTFADGWRFVRQRPPVLLALLIKAGGHVGSIDTLIIVYGTSLFAIGDKGATSLGILWASFGVGSIMGPLLFSRFNDNTIRTMRRLLIFAYGLLSLGWFILGAADSLTIAAVALFVRAMGGSVYWTYSTVILQKLTPLDYLGRIFSMDWFGWQAVLTVSIIVTGVFLEQLGEGSVRGVVIGTGILSLTVLVLWSQAVRWLERRESPLEVAPQQSASTL